MYLNKLKKPNGDIYLSIREKYHVPKKGARERTVESIGYLSKLKEQYDDPITTIQIPPRAQGIHEDEPKKYHPAPKIQKYAIQKKRLKPLPLLGLSQFCFQT